MDIPFSPPSFSAEEQLLAQSLVKAIRQSGAVRLEAEGASFVAPPNTAQQIASLLSMTAESIPAEVVPTVPSMSFGQTAEYLGISEQRLKKLLDAGVIPNDGQHETILTEHLYEYDRKKQLARLMMSQITGDSQEMGLYDEQND